MCVFRLLYRNRRSSRSLLPKVIRAHRVTARLLLQRHVLPVPNVRSRLALGCHARRNIRVDGNFIRHLWSSRGEGRGLILVLACENSGEVVLAEDFQDGQARADDACVHLDYAARFDAEPLDSWRFRSFV